MSIETVSSRPEGPATPVAFAAPPADPPAADSPRSPLAPDATCTETLQARRLRVARDLELRINHLEQELQAQAAALSQSGASIRLTLRELQQRSASLTTELLRTGARLARLGRVQEEHQRQLEARLAEGLRHIQTAIAPLDAALRQQAQQLNDIQERQDTLSRLHHHLDRIVHRAGGQQDYFTAEFQQRLTLLDVTLETQQELANDQHGSLLALTLQHEQATLDIQRLRAGLDDFTAQLEQRLQQLRHRQLILTSLLAVLALLSLGLIGWCQTHPVTLPPKARQQIAILASDLQQQRDQGQAQAGALSRHERQLTDLQLALAQERKQSRRMHQEARLHEHQIHEVRTQLATLREAVDSVPPNRTATTSR